MLYQVQPMKAIASVALATKMNRQETMGAGLAVGAIVLLLSVTGLIERAGRIIPVPIVKGIQIGAGLTLIVNAGAGMGRFVFPDSWDPLLWALLAAGLVFATSRNTRCPLALVIFIIGLILSFPGSFPNLTTQNPRYDFPEYSSIINGFWIAGAGQLPLTILNSIIAVNHLSQHLLPLREPPSITALGISVGLMNLIGCLFGSMPVCHGMDSPFLNLH